MTAYEKAKASIEETLKKEWVSDSLKAAAQKWWDEMKRKVEGDPQPPEA